MAISQGAWGRRGARLLVAAMIGLAASSTAARADFQAGAEAYSRGDYKTAINEWVPYAENGDPRALFNLGQMHRLGIGTEKNLDKAEQYYRRAAERGHVGAQANLGSLLFDRKPPQASEALTFWRQAATGGDAKAQFLTGVQYFNGDHVTRDHVQAYAWLSLAAKAGVKEAADALATVKGYMDPSAIEQATKLASTLVIPPSPQVAEPPGMQAKLAADIEAQLDSAVLRHPVEEFSAGELAPISPDAVAGAIPIPPIEETAAPPVKPPPASVPPVARPAPVPEAKDGEYRAQFASFRTDADAQALRRTILDVHGKVLNGAGIDVDQVLSTGAQGVTYRVRSTPLKGGEAAARSICARLEAGGIPCQPARTVKVPVNVRTAPVAASAVAPASPPVQSPPIQTPPAQAAPAQAAPAQSPPPPTVNPPPPPAVSAEDSAAPASPPEAADEPGPRPAHPGDRWRVQVGAGKTEEEARFRWSRLMGANADLLDAAELYIYKADLGAKGVFYRVQIGGFGTRPDAIGLCERLKSRKVDCFVTGTKQ